MTPIVEGLTAFLVKVLLRPKVYYVEPPKHLHKLDEPSLLIINHTSHLDGPVVTTVFRKDRIHNLAAKDRFEQRGFGFFLRHTRCIPIDRKHGDLTWINESLKTLQQDKESVAIFPEGRHGEHRKQLRFQKGAAMLAAVSKVPIVMVYIDGPIKILGPRARLIVSPPFHLNPPSQKVYSHYIKEQTEVLQQKMKALMEELMKRMKQRARLGEAGRVLGAGAKVSGIIVSCFK
ncbi:MAG: 1-acyl-sn-glycerol-3-phosphate acyltransferase [Bacteroidales bacterium]|nr:1-acyl-sn-glycerol-3-phosphate acyltransferase [Bacteroidales bacterium]